MAGITRYGSYLPYNRLERGALGAGKGERTVASYDEDSVSMAVEAGRDAVRDAGEIETLVFATTSPPYAEKLNAATIAAALDLPAQRARARARQLHAHGPRRAARGRRRRRGRRTRARRRADVVIGAPGGARESGGGDGAAAFVLGSDSEAIARLRRARLGDDRDPRRVAPARVTRSRSSGRSASAPRHSGPIARRHGDARAKSAGIGPADLKTVVLDGTNARAVAFVPRGAAAEARAARRSARSARSGAPAPRTSGLVLARALDRAIARRQDPRAVRRRRLRRARARGHRAHRAAARPRTRSTAGSARSAAASRTTPI